MGFAEPSLEGLLRLVDSDVKLGLDLPLGRFEFCYLLSMVLEIDLKLSDASLVVDELGLHGCDFQVCRLRLSFLVEGPSLLGLCHLGGHGQIYGVHFGKYVL